MTNTEKSNSGNSDKPEHPENAEALNASDKASEVQEEKVESAEQVDQEQINEGQLNQDQVSIESLQVELDTQKAQFTDQLLRTKAEMENVRRRTDKQISDNRKYANEGIAKELLNVRDSLQIASDTEIEAEDSDAVKSMREGLELTLKQMDSLFEKFSIVEISPEAGDKLDPNLHQAMTMVPSEDVEPGCVVSTIQRGYQLHERLLRPAMVVVAQK